MNMNQSEDPSDDPSLAEYVYETDHGRLLNARIETFLDSPASNELHQQVDLIVTSPPFPLLTKKKDRR